MAIYTLYDGSQVRLPDGLSDEYATNLIAKALPSKAANVGEFYAWDVVNFASEVSSRTLSSRSSWIRSLTTGA